MDSLLLLQYAAPVALAAMGETISQKSGVINIGLEGLMLLSAFGGLLVDSATHNPYLACLAGLLIGVLVAALSGAFTVSFGVDQVVVGTSINLLALGLTGTLFRAQYGQSGQLLSIPRLPGFHGLDAVTVFMVLAAPAIAWLLNRTGWGLAVRSAGEYPPAAEAAGFSVARLRYSAICLGGAFGGLGGAYLSAGVAGSFAENMTAGRGFVAIAMVTFGRWKPSWVFAAALLIGFAESLQFRFQSLGWKVPFQLWIAMPYALALLVLVLVGKGTVAPGALGQPFRKEK